MDKEDLAIVKKDTESQGAMPASSNGTAFGEKDPVLEVGRLGALHSLFSTTRKATEYDLLLATMGELLRSGPRSVDSLIGEINRLWPGSKSDRNTVQSALDVGVSAAILVPVSMLDGPGYDLSENGRAELTPSHDWAADVYNEFTLDLMEHAKATYGAVTFAQGKLWAGILSRAIALGIANSHSAHTGSVQRLPDSMLIPTSYDLSGIKTYVERSTQQAELREFLIAMALAALDATDIFGNQLVNCISTAFILQAFLARRDQLAARGLVGSLAGQVVILDTPVLLRLLAPRRFASAIEAAIHRALEEGAEVLVLDHVADELRDVVERVERQDARQIEMSLKQGVDPGRLANLTGDEVLDMWLDGQKTGIYGSWDDFKRTALGLAESLRKTGATRRSHENDGDSSKVGEFIQALRSTLKGPGNSRGDAALRRDGNSLGVAYRVRNSAPPKEQSLWPRAWIVTTDTHMKSAYASVCKSDPTSVTIAPSQWVGVLCTCCSPTSLSDLVQSAADIVALETTLGVAAKYPPAVAVEIARALSGEGDGGDIDLRVAQLTFDSIIGGAIDGEGDPAVEAARITTEVLARKNRRLSIGYSDMQNRAAQKEEASAQAVAANGLVLDVKTKEIDDLRQLVGQLDRKLQDSDQARQSDAAAQESARNRNRRRLIVLNVVWVALLAAVVMFLFRLYWAGAGTLLALVVYGRLSHDWVVNLDQSWSRMLYALIPELLIVVDIVRGWFF